MEPIFIYYNNLIFDDEKKFSVNFSNEDSLEDVVFKKNRLLYNEYDMLCGFNC